MKSLMPRLILTLMLFPVGCAWQSDSGRRAELMPAPAITLTLASTGAVAKTSAGWPDSEWWRSFKSPELNRLVALAIKDSPGLKRVAARLAQTQALADAQGAALYPTLESGISLSAQRFSANSVQAKLAGEQFRSLIFNPLQLRYHLDLWGADAAALQAAIGKAQAAESELADAKLLLAVSVAHAYFGLRKLTDLLTVNGHILDCRNQLAHLEQIRLDNGLTSSAPVLETQSGLHAIREQRALLRSKQENQKHAIAALLGQGPDNLGDLLTETGAMPVFPSLPANLPLTLLSRRPDLVAAKMRVEAAAQDIKVANTAFYPDVNLIAFGGLHSVSLSDVLLQGTSLAYAVGPSVTFPLFEGGRLRANLKYRESTYDEAVEIYNTQLLRAIQEVADAIERWREIAARLDEQTQVTNALKDSRRIADSLFREGLNNRKGSLTACIEERTQQLKLADLQAEFLKSAVDLFSALGGGYRQKNSGG